MLTTITRNERERLRKLATRKGFKLKTVRMFDNGGHAVAPHYTLTRDGHEMAFVDLSDLCDYFCKPDRTMSTYEACSIAEGFDGGENATEQQKIVAWQFLIDTGAVNTLQGWFGRTAASLIEQGICKPAARRNETEAAAQVAA